MLLLNQEGLLAPSGTGVAVRATEQASSGFLDAVSDIDNSQQEQADKADKKAAYDAQQKALKAAAKAKESWKKVQDIAAAKNNPNVNVALNSISSNQQVQESK